MLLRLKGRGRKKNQQSNGGGQPHTPHNSYMEMHVFSFTKEKGHLHYIEGPLHGQGTRAEGKRNNHRKLEQDGQ